MLQGIGKVIIDWDQFDQRNASLKYIRFSPSI